MATVSHKHPGDCSEVPLVFSCDNRRTYGLHALREPRQVSVPSQRSAMPIQCVSIKNKVV